jgi:hypothetical protein
VRPSLIVAFVLTLLFAACSHADPLARRFFSEQAPVLFHEKNKLTGEYEWVLQYRTVTSIPGHWYAWVCFVEESKRYAHCLYRNADDPADVEQREEYVGDQT